MEPQTLTQPIATSQPVVAPAHLQARVNYGHGFFGLATNPGILEWSADGRIRLFQMDHNFSQSAGVAFDVSPAEVKSVSGFVSNLVITLTNGQKYGVNFSVTSALAFGALGGLVGAIASDAINKSAGLPNWLEKFRTSGVKVSYTSGLKLFGIAALAGVGFVVVLVAIFVAIGMNS